MEAVVSAESWHEERDRLVQLLEGIESGRITHFDEDDTGQLRRETTVQQVDRLKRRVAELDTRLGSNDPA